ncbi:MAG TPA: hypothetical protein DCL41_02605 [Bdellovibrionales bacterium]|nr:hypothetical protein [Pseudobdellovibrionaceae bacterium]HAG90731.1 hypothetical protein [Bdellovibrionales bacterium]|tara:strand:- start:3995 stop:4915 length:921 start_codon:yes stop_codon:yes gene_type:complete
MIALIASLSLGFTVGCSGKSAEKRQRIAGQITGADKTTKEEGTNPASSEGDSTKNTDPAKKADVSGAQVGGTTENQSGILEASSKLALPNAQVVSWEELSGSKLNLQKFSVLVYQMDDDNKKVFTGLVAKSVEKDQNGQSSMVNMDLGLGLTSVGQFSGSLIGIDVLSQGEVGGTGQLLSGADKDPKKFSLRPSLLGGVLSLNTGEIQSKNLSEDMVEILASSTVSTHQADFKEFISKDLSLGAVLSQVKKAESEVEILLSFTSTDGKTNQEVRLIYSVEKTQTQSAENTGADEERPAGQEESALN